MRLPGIFVRKRLAFIFLGSLIIFLLLLMKIGWIQFMRGDDFQEMALDSRMREIPIEAMRGDIYDRNGEKLVTSINVDSVYALPRQVENPEEAAEILAPILEMDKDRIYKILSRNSAYEWIKRKISKEMSQKIKELNLSGIFMIEESKRQYLHETLAPHLLGFTGVDNQGLIGIEKTYDQFLQGEAGSILVEHDAGGRKLSDSIQKYVNPQKGDSLILTLDENIQYFVERELDKVVARYQPELAVVIVMEPDTGEILAMGNRPTFNSNSWGDVEVSVWDRNPAIWYNYEPGSTFKIVTVSAAVNEKVVSREDTFFDPGYVSVADRNIRCWKDGGHGSQSFEQAVMNSCNPAFVEIGLSLGIERFYKYLESFCFGEKTGIDLPGEASGIIIQQENATNLNLATMAMGQSIAVTPIQLIRAVSAVANGGTLMEPLLVKEVVNEKGESVKAFKAEKVKQILSLESSKEVASLLEKVVAEGTGRNAFVEGYRVAGKTGTAQVVGESGGYVDGEYVASFAGFAPADDPQFAMLIMIAKPQGGVYYGGQVAAPVFQAIATDILHYLKVPEDKSLVKPKDPALWYEPIKVEVEVPLVEHYPVNEATKMLAQYGLTAKTNGEGSIVYSQTPKGGTMVYTGTEVLLNLDVALDKNKKITVPNLTGLTEEEAINLLLEMNLFAEIEGTGLVSEQNPASGTMVSKGSKIELNLKAPGNKEELPSLAPIISQELIMD